MSAHTTGQIVSIVTVLAADQPAAVAVALAVVSDALKHPVAASTRQMTLAHPANPNPDAIWEYIIAIGHWEVFLSRTYQAWCLLARGQKILFAPGDGSTMQRLCLLYNRTKHAESAITAEQLPPDGTLPVWLKNDGLHGVESSLTFEEIEEMLEDLAVWADAAQNPATVREKIAVKYGINLDDQDS